MSYTVQQVCTSNPVKEQETIQYVYRICHFLIFTVFKIVLSFQDPPCNSLNSLLVMELFKKLVYPPKPRNAEDLKNRIGAGSAIHENIIRTELL